MFEENSLNGAVISDSHFEHLLSSVLSLLSSSATSKNNKTQSCRSSKYTAFKFNFAHDVDRITYSVLPRDVGVGEGSWSGLCFSPIQWFMAAVAQSFCKSVDVYDQDIHLRTFRTLWYPSSLNFMQNLGHGIETSILAVTEGCQLSIWDLRMKENGGCLNRICGSVGDALYAVSSSSTGNIAVAGADRTVTIYDPRRLLDLLSHLLTPTTSMYKGLTMRSFVVSGKKAVKVFSFRGDSNWLGFSKCSNRDLLGGWCDSGSIFVANVVAKGE